MDARGRPDHSKLAFAVLILRSVMTGIPLAHADEEIRLEGRVGLELRVRDRIEEASFDREAELSLSTGRREGIKAVMELNATAESSGVDLEGLYLDYKPPEGSGSGKRWRLGQSRIRFGLDADQGTEKRLALGRSAVYRALQAFSYVGRDMSLALSFGGLEERSVVHEISLHGSSAFKAAAIYRMELGLGTSARIISTSLVQRKLVDGTGRYSGAQAFSYTDALGAARVEGELFAGSDPIESARLSAQGIAEGVYFAAVKVGSSWRLGKAEPFARASAVFHQVPRWGDREQEWTLGTRYFAQERFQLGIELGFVGSSSQGLLAARYFF